MTSSKPTACRGAFTLIELLVVIILIMILAGLAAAFLPAIGDSARAAQGATLLQQWILTARQKALRDQVPCGLRLIPYVDPVDNLTVYKNKAGTLQMAAQVRQCQYIEQPDDFAVSPTQTANIGNVGKLMTEKPPTGTAPAHPVVYICSKYPNGGFLQINKQVAVGDYLEILGNGLMHKITSIGPPQVYSNSPTSEVTTEIALNSLPLYPVANTRQWRIVRAPRATGDDLLQLPAGVIIDLKSNDPDYSGAWVNTVPVLRLPANQKPPIFTPIDIIFSPSGAVISPGFTNDTINLWVREYNPMPNPTPPPPFIDPHAGDPGHGEQTIIAIYVRTGLTAAHPPAPFPWGPYGPYAFIVDGRTSGK
jgi:Tfp pilus assembly protein FimT